MIPGWRPRLAEALRERSSPVLFTRDDVIPAASLWTGSRLWVAAFRAAGLEPGDRLVVALEPSAAFVQVLVAALWEGLTIALVPSGSDLAALLDELDARAVVSQDGHAGPGWVPDGCGGPLPGRPALHHSRLPATPQASLLLRTSGTSGPPTWVALSEHNVCAVLDSHLPELALTGAYVVSVLPWHHAFGLVLDLLPALLSGAYLHRDPSCGRDVAGLAELLRRTPAALSAVPATIAALAALPDGRALLAALTGGVVGGAPVSPPLAEVLATTSLRAGYGQTEASPGITLGRPGDWRAGMMGRPLGCSVRLVDGALEFRGANASLGTWGAGGLTVLDPSRWVATGDAVEQAGDDLVFRGRLHDHFKLANGRWVPTTQLEPRLRQALPAGTDAMVYTADGSALDVLVIPPGAGSIDVDAQIPVVRAALGALGASLGTVRLLASEQVVRDGKGAIDRRATSSRAVA